MTKLFTSRVAEISTTTASAISGAIAITGLQFFNTQNNSGATSMPSGTWTITLSTTNANWNTLSTNFDTNVGANKIVVFSGNLTQPWSFGNTLTITLSRSFIYTPANGNLLIDVTASGTVAPGGYIFFDTNGFNGGARNGNSTFGMVDFDGVFSGYGLVTGFVGPSIGQCVFSPTGQCQPQGGTLCATPNNGAGTCANPILLRNSEHVRENACLCVPPNYTLSVSPFNPLIVCPGAAATAEVVVIPQTTTTGAFLGDVTLSAMCPSPAWTCTFSQNPITSTGSPAHSTLTAIPPTSTSSSVTNTITVSAIASILPPTNGPQSTPLTVTCHYTVGDGGGSIALLTFLGLVGLWLMLRMRRMKRAFLR